MIYFYDWMGYIRQDTADLSVIGKVTEKLMLDTRILHFMRNSSQSRCGISSSTVHWSQVELETDHLMSSTICFVLKSHHLGMIF